MCVYLEIALADGVVKFGFALIKLQLVENYILHMQSVFCTGFFCKCVQYVAKVQY